MEKRRLMDIALFYFYPSGGAEGRLGGDNGNNRIHHPDGANISNICLHLFQRYVKEIFLGIAWDVNVCVNII